MTLSKFEMITYMHKSLDDYLTKKVVLTNRWVYSKKKNVFCTHSDTTSLIARGLHRTRNEMFLPKNLGIVFRSVSHQRINQIKPAMS